MQNLLTSILIIQEVSQKNFNKENCELDKILRNFSTITSDFQLFLSITQLYVAFRYYFINKGSILTLLYDLSVPKYSKFLSILTSIIRAKV